MRLTGAPPRPKSFLSLSQRLSFLLFSHLFLSLSSFRPPPKKKQIPPPRRSRRGALRLARLGGIFALGGVLAARAGAAVYTPIRGIASPATEANNRAAASATPGVKGLFADPELAHRDADYAHFAELLGTVMLMREGGEKYIFSPFKEERRGET